GAGNLSEPGRLTVRVDGAAAPPVNLHSPTHPDPAVWYAAREAAIRWEAPAEASGIAAFRWTVIPADGAPADPKTWTRAASAGLTVPLPGDGRWTVAVATEDGAGNLSAPETVTLMADSQAEAPLLTSPTHPDPAV